MTLFYRYLVDYKIIAYEAARSLKTKNTHISITYLVIWWKFFWKKKRIFEHTFTVSVIHCLLPPLGVPEDAEAGYSFCDNLSKILKNQKYSSFETIFGTCVTCLILKFWLKIYNFADERRSVGKRMYYSRLLSAMSAIHAHRVSVLAFLISCIGID